MEKVHFYIPRKSSLLYFSGRAHHLSDCFDLERRVLSENNCATEANFAYAPFQFILNISDSKGIILGPRSQTLLIERVQEDDAGLYQCVATNLKGTVETSAYITIQGKDLHVNETLIGLIYLFSSLICSCARSGFPSWMSCTVQRNR